MLALLLNSVLAYMLGSVSGSLLLGRLRQVDIRQFGSGNAGGTNALRSQGFSFALGVVIIDVGKGVLAASLPAWLTWNGAPNPAGPLLCAFAAVLGHCYPMWHGFRGGKGAATAVGGLFVIQPLTLVPMLTLWFLCLIVTGMVGLATMLAGVALVPALLWLGASPLEMYFGVAVALFLIFTHRNNIRAMVDGKEYRFERVRLRNWFRRGQ
jgi:glycerol-3-phosphate acyltransferase PlsY